MQKEQELPRLVQESEDDGDFIGLPIWMCAACKAKNADPSSLDGIKEAVELCETCSDTTQAAWEARRDRGISIEEMMDLMKNRNTQ